MKLKQLNAQGFAHHMVAAIIVVSAALGGTYYLVASHADPVSTTTTTPTSNDIPVPADYTGSNHAEIAVWRPSNGTWYVSANNSGATTAETQWGQNGDIPVPADYTGAGHADYAVFRPSNGTWYVKGVEDVQWGQNGDIPIPGDYNGDGKTDLAVFRPSTGIAYVRGIGNYRYYSVWGPSYNQALAVDYNFSDTNNHVLAQPFIYSSQYGGAIGLCQGGTTTNAGEDCVSVYPLGKAGDIAFAYNYGPFQRLNNIADIGVWRPSNGTWYYPANPNTSSLSEVQWGVNGDVPVPADYNGDKKTDLAVWRPSNATWYIRGIATVKYGNPY